MSEKFEWGVSTLAGAQIKIIKKLEKEYVIQVNYRRKWWYSKLVSRLMTVLAYGDQFRFQQVEKKIESIPPPVFVIGHWRSGTTLLHNILCELTDSAFCSTYQNIFPNNLFAFYSIIRPTVQYFFPKRRPSDNIRMHTRFPQEEEFALGNEIPFCFYYWMFFPQDTLTIADRYLAGKSASDEEISLWKSNYRRFIKRCMLKTGGQQFISKNPPNTARIKWLLELFPDAKFIFLHRNPYDAVRSTSLFYRGILPAQQYQEISDELLLDQVLTIYQQLHDRYLTDRSLIPTANLIEIPFDEFITAPLAHTSRMLNQFKIASNITPELEQKHQTNDHQTRRYEHSRELIAQINACLSPYFDAFGYEKMEE